MGEDNYHYGQQQSGGIYRDDPELTKYVNQVGKSLAKACDRSDLPYEFVIINSSVPNAWAMPGGKITINRGLLVELHSEAELAAVLAHEITHAAARHGAKSMERGLILTTGLGATSILLSDPEHRVRNTAILTSASVAAGLVTMRYGREAELEADHYGMHIMAKAGYDPKAAISLQQTFVKLSEEKKTNWLKGLFASHPPSQERVKANELTAQKLPQGLKQGKKEYQLHLAKLMKQKPAYDQYEEAQKALAKGEEAKALESSEKAIALRPTEALFYTLKGDILAKQKNYTLALENYTKAISLDAEYFYPHLQKGLVLEKMGKKQQARNALHQSLALLPTKSATLALERI